MALAEDLDTDDWQPRPSWTGVTVYNPPSEPYYDAKSALGAYQEHTLDRWAEYDAELEREREERLKALMEAETAVWVTVLEEWARARPAWMQRADCRSYEPDDFHPERGQDTRPLKAVCAGCPVRQDCLDYALDNAIKHGIWGGTSERERRLLRRRRKRGSC